MKSPFPGMDPYLEPHWGDMQKRLVTYAADQLQPRLTDTGLQDRKENPIPQREQQWSDVQVSLVTYARDQLQPQLDNHRLCARMRTREFVEPEECQNRPTRPPISVGDGQRATRGSAGTPRAIVNPITIFDDEPMTQPFIEILDFSAKNRVVTVIEILCPANKVKGEGRTQYRKKQRECKESGVSLVEIDLLRGGKWGLTVPEHRIPTTHRTAYCVCVRRGWMTCAYEVYRAPLRERLPAIKIPLRETDADVLLELQPLIEKAYVNGGYDDIDYTFEPVPPLDADDAAWADALLKAAKLR